MSLDALRVERRPSLPKDAPYQDRFMAELPHRLPDDATVATLSCGTLLILRQGAAIGLALIEPRVTVSNALFSTQTKLRTAGVRFEFARDMREAWKRLTEMGIPLKAREDSPYAARAMFREESARRVRAR